MSGYAYAAMAGLQIAQGLHQAQMIREQSAVQSELNEFNAQFAELDAYEAEKFGETQVAAYDKNVTAVVGEQRARMAAADIDVSYGTASQIQDETKFNGYLNALDIRNQAHAKSLGFKREARMIRLGSTMQSSQAAMQARAAITSGVMGALQTGLSGYAKYGKSSSTTSSEPVAWTGGAHSRTRED